MITNKLPQSVATDSQAAGSQSQRYSHPDMSTGYVTAAHLKPRATSPSNSASIDSGYKKPIKNYAHKHKRPVSSDDAQKRSPLVEQHSAAIHAQYLESDLYSETSDDRDHAHKRYQQQKTSAALPKKTADIPERVFMNGLIKHTAIALAIIVPLAAFSAYAASPQVLPVNTTPARASSPQPTTATIDIEPSAIIYNSATVPTTVDSVDLQQYAGTWYEIGRLPMYFQRKCAHDVTATYTEKSDGSGIIVTNKCSDAEGQIISADGLAKPIDASGSQLKVTFLPSWIRWLPVGRADYWVLARDADYQTALVGTPDKKYLWLLARSPNLTQQTYAKYRQIAQQQGYSLKEFQLTPQTNQSVKLVP